MRTCFLEGHFFRNGCEAVDNCKLTRAGITQLLFLFFAKGIILVFFQQEHGIEKIILGEPLEVDRLAFKVRVAFYPFRTGVIVVGSEMPGQDVVQDTKVVCVHVIPARGGVQTLLQNQQHFFDNTYPANFICCWEKFPDFFIPVFFGLAFDEIDQVQFFIKRILKKFHWLKMVIATQARVHLDPMDILFVVNVIFKDQHSAVETLTKPIDGIFNRV